MTRDEYLGMMYKPTGPRLGLTPRLNMNNQPVDISRYTGGRDARDAGAAAAAGAGAAVSVNPLGQANTGGEGRGGDSSQSEGISNGFGSTAGNLNAGNSVPGANYSQQGALVGSLFGSTLGIGPALGAQLGKAVGSSFSQSMYNGYGALDGTTSPATGPGTIGSRDNYGSNQSASDAATDAANSAMSDARAAMGEGGFGGAPSGPADSTSAMSDARGAMGEGGFGGNSSAGDGTGGTAGNSSSDAGSNDGRSGFYKGGRVTPKRLSGPNPKGPDDGYAALDKNEFVLRAAATKRLGFTKLKALNEGRADIVMKGR